ncbi:MAG: transglycosylase SLT domain-containing protein [Frankia sp.]
MAPFAGPAGLGRRAGLAATLGLLLCAVIVLVGGCSIGSSGGSSPVAPDTDHVPAELIPLFRAAAAAYPSLTPAELAAQARVESKFDPLAVSRAGARGLMQFMPDTWKHFGVDGDRDGRTDPLDPADAIPAAARYEAHLATLLKAVPGNRLSLVLAAYNAGPGAVLSARGIPTFDETQDYISRVRSWALRFGPQFTASRPAT